MEDHPLPLVNYPPVLLDAVAYRHAGDYELSVKTLEQLDPGLAMTQLVSMFGELARRYERKCGFEPGTVIPRLRAHYEACIELTPDPPAPRPNRRVNR